MISQKTEPAVYYNQHLRKIIRSIIRGDKDRNKTDDEKVRTDLMEKCLRPESLVAPKVNKEIWRTLSSSTRSKDLEAQKPQKLILHAIVPIASIVDKLIQNEPQGNDCATNGVVDTLMDAIAMLSITNGNMNTSRRNAIKPSLNADYRASSLPQNPVTDNLFGENLSEQLKRSQRRTRWKKRSTPTMMSARVTVPRGLF